MIQKPPVSEHSDTGVFLSGHSGVFPGYVRIVIIFRTIFPIPPPQTQGEQECRKKVSTIYSRLT